jgi:N-acetylmuramoyl-L-alanine amidase
LDQLEAVGISQNRGVRVGTQFDSENNYIVIKQTNMTGLIIEMGFISNETDVELYDENMDDYAAAIANGIISWLNEYVK